MPTISVLIKPASGMCNMQCDYCFYCDEMKKRSQDSYVRIPLERNSLHASAGRLSAPNGKFFKLHWITHVLAI